LRCTLGSGSLAKAGFAKQERGSGGAALQKILKRFRYLPAAMVPVVPMVAVMAAVNRVMAAAVVVPLPMARAGRRRCHGAHEYEAARQSGKSLDAKLHLSSPVL
jgi:hypothetical protein